MLLTPQTLTATLCLLISSLAACGDDATDPTPAATPDTALAPSDTGMSSDVVGTPDSVAPGPVIDEGCIVPAPDQSLCEGVTCDGTSICIAGVCVAQPTSGDLVITEILYNPPSHDLGQEWFEVKNVRDHDVTLRGMSVSNGDASETFTVAALTLVPSGCHAVLAQDGATAGGVASSTWKGEDTFYLQNTRDQIVLSVEGVEIDRVDYDEDLEWPAANGASIALDPGYEAGDNNDPAGWCFGIDSLEAMTPDGTKTWGKGSPGAENPICDFECFKYNCAQRPDECTEAGMLKTYSGDGICIPDSGCDFSTVSETLDCATEYGSSFVCQSGACVDPCEGLLCNSPPANECAGNSVAEYGTTGTCAAGLCTYPVTATTDCGADVCSTATGPASCVDASLAGVPLSGYRVQLLQNGVAPENIKLDVELSGDYAHGQYILMTRNATLVAWPTLFTPALDGAAVANIAEHHDSEDSWQFNSNDDPVRVLDPTGQVLDIAYGVKNGVNRRQADGSWLQVEGSVSAGAIGAPNTVAGAPGPLYVYEVGEACGDCPLTDFNGNYVLIYIP
jgi:hypothetical protein